MAKELSNEEKAMLLLQRGFALELARTMRIKHKHDLSPLKSVDLISLVVRALRALERENPLRAEKELTELLAVLVAGPLDLNTELGFELLVRDDSRKVRALATQICRREAEGQTHLSPDSNSPIETDFELETNIHETEEEN
jgi:hypothetical protein